MPADCSQQYNKGACALADLLRCKCLQADLHGVVPVQQQAFQTLQTRATLWSNKLIQAAAVCNGLTMVNKTTVVGDGMERSLFTAVEARFLVGYCCSLQTSHSQPCM